MKILHLNTYDTKGGAARAAHRLHRASRQIGIDSNMLVQYKESADPTVSGQYTGRLGWLKSKAWEVLDSVPLYRYPSRGSNPFSPAWVSSYGRDPVMRDEFDLLHLHWITNGFLKPAVIGGLDRPILWTCHDMWPFTGGCHYSGECNKYEKACGACPQLGSRREMDLSRSLWGRKRDALENIDEVVVPSEWLADRARASSLFGNQTVHVIPNALDIESFTPTPGDGSPEEFGLPTGKPLVLFGGMAAGKDPRKGLDLLRDAILPLASRKDQVDFDLVIFGTQHSAEFGLEVETHHVGYVDDEFLPRLYAAADVTVVPSRQESFGQIASESLACGTPVAAFRTTGLRDIVDHRETGYLAEPFEPGDLADGIVWLLSNRDRLDDLSGRARQTAVERFSMERVAKAYHDLYRGLVDG